MLYLTLCRWPDHGALFHSPSPPLHPRLGLFRSPQSLCQQKARSLRWVSTWRHSTRKHARQNQSNRINRYNQDKKREPHHVAYGRAIDKVGKTFQSTGTGNERFRELSAWSRPYLIMIRNLSGLFLMNGQLFMKIVQKRNNVHEAGKPRVLPHLVQFVTQLLSLLLQRSTKILQLVVLAFHRRHLLLHLGALQGKSTHYN